MKIANILTNNSIKISDEFNVVKTIDKIIDGLPTLIIGFDYVNKNYPNFDILNKEIKTNLFWTFKKTERRDKHEEDLIWFVNKVYEDLSKNIKYISIDPLQYHYKSIFKIIKKLYSMTNIISFVYNDMIYIYGDNFIFGVDLKLMKYIGLNIDKIKTKIKDKSVVFLDNNEILIEYKNYIEELGLQVKYLPFLYYIRNEQNNTISDFYISRKS